MKRKLSILFVLLTGLVCLVGFIFAQDGFDIKLTNQTKYKISGLYVTFEHISSPIQIPSLAPGEEYSLNVDPAQLSTKNFDEAALLLKYKDHNGKTHTEYIIGYFEKGYSGEASITIKSVRPNGKLEMDIHENTSL